MEAGEMLGCSERQSGPNSNPFTAWIGLEVPGLNLDLPAKAIGQSWMIAGHPALSAESL